MGLLAVILVLIGIFLGVCLSWFINKNDDPDKTGQTESVDTSENSTKKFLNRIATRTDADDSVAENLRDTYLVTIKSVSRDLLGNGEKQVFDCLEDFISIIPARYLGTYFECRYLDDVQVPFVDDFGEKWSDETTV